MKEPLWARDGGSLAASPLQGVGTSTYPPPAASGRTALTPVIRLPSSPQGASAPSRNRAASVSHRVVGRAWIFVCVCARSQLPSAAFLVVCDHHQLNRLIERDRVLVMAAGAAACIAAVLQQQGPTLAAAGPPTPARQIHHATRCAAAEQPRSAVGRRRSLSAARGARPFDWESYR